MPSEFSHSSLSAETDRSSAEESGRQLTKSRQPHMCCHKLCMSMGWGRFLDSFEFHIKQKDRVKQRMAKEGESWDQAWEELQKDWREHDTLNRELAEFESPPGDPAATKSIAFMFLTVAPLNREDVWIPWFKDAPSTQYDVLVHNDKDTSLGELDRLARKVSPATKTGWASSGLVRATILLLREALKKRANTHFILLSNSEVPLYSFAELYEKVTSQSASRFHKMGLNFDESLGRTIWQDANGRDWQGCTKGHCFSKADQWSMWTRADAAFFAENNFLKYLKPCTLFVDEPYFVELMYQYERRFDDKYVTYTSWKFLADSPTTFEDVLDDEVVAQARSSDAWFLRKVSRNATLSDGYRRTVFNA